MDKKIFEKIMNVYKEAWETQNSDLILTIFIQSGIYHDKPFNNPIEGHDLIKQYWNKYPVNDQKNIKFTLGKYTFSEGIWYAEWESEFDELSTGKYVNLKGIFLIELELDKIKILREYWHLKRI